MAAEKDTQIEFGDDWLEDVSSDTQGIEVPSESPSEEISLELDQSAIDSLLGSNVATNPPQQNSPAVAEDNDAFELDQDTIDNLLKGVNPEPPNNASSQTTEQDIELDQNDIDKLFAIGMGDVKEEAVKQEVGQDAIDNLFDGAAFKKEEPSPLVSEESLELDQGDIDKLFFGGLDNKEQESALQEGALAGLAQEDVNALFFEKNRTFETLQQSAPALTSTPVDNKVHPQGLDQFAGNEEETQIQSMSMRTSVQAESEPEKKDPPKKMPAATSEQSGKKWRIKIPRPIPRRVLITAIAAGITMIVGVGLFLYGSKGKKASEAIKEPPPVVTVATEPAPIAQPVIPPPNRPPEVMDREINFEQIAGGIDINLMGTDPDEEPLRFEITKAPEYGTISGGYPNITYTPTSAFPGSDHLEYQAFDGKDKSRIAMVTISGPDMTQAKIVKQKSTQSEKPFLAAKNVTLTGLSTQPILINWQEIWHQANKYSFPDQGRVEINKSNLHGELTKIGPSLYQYQPQRVFSGTEEIWYHFRVGDKKSSIKRLALRINRGDFPPQIHLSTLAPDDIGVGDTVVLDASKTTDEDRRALTFRWQQIAGIPVLLEPKNLEKSAVSLVMPATFPTGKYPDVVIQMTATDKCGQDASDRVTLRVTKPISTRHSVLWPPH